MCNIISMSRLLFPVFLLAMFYSCGKEAKNTETVMNTNFIDENTSTQTNKVVYILPLENKANSKFYHNTALIQEILFNSFYSFIPYLPRVDVPEKSVLLGLKAGDAATVSNEYKPDYIVYGSYILKGSKSNPNAIISIQVMSRTSGESFSNTYIAPTDIDLFDSVDRIIGEIGSFIIKEKALVAHINFGDFKTGSSEYELRINNRLVARITNNDFKLGLNVLAGKKYHVELERLRDYLKLIDDDVILTPGDSTNYSYASFYYISPDIGTLKYVPAGTFQRDYGVSNKSMVSDFHIGEYDITRAQFSNVMGFDPSDEDYSTGTNDPVQMVNWYMALSFCNKLSMLEGLTPVYSIRGSTDPSKWGAFSLKNNTYIAANRSANGYRLPTEMEWMWAAMGADTANPGRVNYTGYQKAFTGSTGANNIDGYAWTTNNSGNKTHPVGTKLPNELGLYDINGNVWQWCWDWYADYPGGAVTDYAGAASGYYRVLRGGSWFENVSCAAVAYRYSNSPYLSSYDLGFRVVRP